MNDDEILRVIAHNVVKKTQGDPEKITAESTLAEVGLDSLGFIEVIFDVEEDLGISLQNVEVEGNTVGSLINAVKLALPPANTAGENTPLCEDRLPDGRS